MTRVNLAYDADDGRIQVSIINTDGDTEVIDVPLTAIIAPLQSVTVDFDTGEYEVNGIEV